MFSSRSPHDQDASHHSSRPVEGSNPPRWQSLPRRLVLEARFPLRVQGLAASIEEVREYCSNGMSGAAL
jgi:hypothetical protein